MEFTDDLWYEVGFVIRSKNRKKVMKSLSRDVRMPSQIAQESGIKTNHVSNNLKQLKEHDLVECVNPEAKKGRLYRFTEKGQLVYEKLNAD